MAETTHQNEVKNEEYKETHMYPVMTHINEDHTCRNVSAIDTKMSTKGDAVHEGNRYEIAIIIDADVSIEVEEISSGTHMIEYVAGELHYAEIEGDTDSHKDLHDYSCKTDLGGNHNTSDSGQEGSNIEVIDQHKEVQPDKYEHRDHHVDSCTIDISKYHTTSDSAQEKNNKGIDGHHVKYVGEESHHEDVKADTYEHKDIHVDSCTADISSYHTTSDSDQEDNNREVIDEHLVECRAEELHHDDVKSDTCEHKDLHVDSCTIENSGNHSCEATLDVDVMVSIEERHIEIVGEHTVDLITEELHHDEVKLHTYDHNDLHVDSCKSDIGENHNTSYSAQEESNIEVIDEHSVECIAKESHNNEVQADTYEHKDVHVEGCSIDIRTYHTTTDRAQEDNNGEVIDEHLVECRAEELHHDDAKSDTYEHKDLHVDSCTLEISGNHSCEATLGVDVMVSIEESHTAIVDEHSVDLIIEELHHDDVKLHTYDHKDLHVESCKPDIGEHHNTRHSAQGESSIEVIDEHSVEYISKESHSHEFQADTHEHKEVHVEGCSIDINSYHTTTDRDQEDNNGEVIDEHLVECRAEELHHDDAKSDTYEYKDLHVDSCTLEISGNHSCEATLDVDVMVSIEDSHTAIVDEHTVDLIIEELHHDDVKLHTYDHKELHVDSCKSDIGENHNTSYSAQEESNIEVIDEHSVECIVKESQR